LETEYIMDTMTLPPPGTPYGACGADCAHRDCAWQRATAAKLCWMCGDPIGHNRLFIEDKDGVVHADCLADELRGGHA
jgi:hypothetical protein